ncbi:UDP-N-acetylmuramoyl-tripeptide--D-alanyl-D-alanine ligase [Paenibacillus paeoniae]|uniref:UDP-N-acetylmuramoyl-tripeptide--D-alanyl-D-alanine ligase n=1 Tax=Paenibacillus paeoniae TaxID=2292705 RepID=A0A371PJ95_9BACL|nr:UDP-N-acetylmuramoyl-tripeptide--D-alanyl-D-alanine ligase [Paenibacillus paeoniae]
MIKRTVGQLASMCGGARKGGRPEEIISGIMTDGRLAGSGELFVPLVGDRFDGHDYVEQAVASGAKAIMWQRGREIPASLAHLPFLLVKDTLEGLQALAAAYRNELMARVIGITGSNGKTTTKDMTAALLSTQYRVLKTEGNLNNHIGLPLTILKMDEETEVAVLEMGMSGFGEIELLTKIAQPDVAIITNIGEAHMLQLGSRNGIAKAKLEITAGLGDDGILLFNGDEPLLHEGLEAMHLPEGITLRTFGLQSSNEWSAADIGLSTDGSTFSARYKDADTGLEKLHISTPGRHNISNALAAIAAARVFGVKPDNIATGYQGLQLTGMRIEPSKAYNGATILNDAYNANPTAVRAAIDLVSGLSGFGRRWIVLGDMLDLGPEEESLHREIGEYITKGKAEAVATFGALAAITVEAAAKNLTEAAEAGYVRHFEDKNELAQWVREQLHPEDLVLVKGSRGMRMEQVVQALEKG